MAWFSWLWDIFVKWLARTQATADSAAVLKRERDAAMKAPKAIEDDERDLEEGKF